MGKTLDVEEFLSWLNETEEELKGERVDELNPDRKDEGILLATENVRKYVEKMCKIDDADEDHRWIPVSEGLPTDDDYRYYMVLVENHIEGVPMFCQCDPYYGFGYYRDIFDPVSLGYVDTEFNTLEELDYEKALYWMQLPKPPYEEEVQL